MRIEEIPTGECFSSDKMEGSYFKERLEPGCKQTYHQYDKDGYLQKTSAFPESGNYWYLSYADGLERNVCNTIEELIVELKRIGKQNFKKAIELFLRDKVLIQRGKQRHSYADLFHKMVEDLSLMVERSTTGYDDDYEKFIIPYGQYRFVEEDNGKKFQYAILKDGGEAEIVWLTEKESKKYGHKAYKVINGLKND